MSLQTEQPSRSKRVFPLHLTPFEEYMFVDDRPRYPMTFIVQLEFSGNLNREAFERALDDALERHALLRALIRPAKQNKDCWVSAGDVKPQVDWGGLHDEIKFEQGEYINLREEVGVRFWIRQDEQQAVVTSQFHHCVCDGIGSYQFLGDLLWSYASHVNAAPDEPQPPLDSAQLRSRGQASYDLENYRNGNGRVQSEWGEAARLMFRRIAPIKVARKPLPADPVFPGIRSHELDKAEYRQLRLRAQELGQTPNELLLEKLFLTLWQWNREQGGFDWRRSYCVMMPMDLRDVEDKIIPAANVVTYTMIRRSARELNDRELLIRSLREELAALKRDRHKTRFMNMLSGIQRYRALLKLMLRGERCIATAVFSNTGDPTKQFHVQFPKEENKTRCGNLILENISGVPPMRPKSRATISIFTYRRVLRICMRCDPNCFSAADTQNLLDAYVKNVVAEINT